ncbi:MAG TPA: serine/threonine-protein kinase [Candidatus Limnocylindria bacterium]|nr:serine/threonine-protein kinase [Candidatus Limnocylindria bacterium]
MSLAPGQQFAGHEIIAELGRGGMGTVYQARQISLQRIVALKILHPHFAKDQDFVTRFQSEAVAAASLNHPNIVQVYAAGESEGIEYIAMEFVEGETIQQRLRRCGRLPLTEALDIAYHVALVLEHGWQTAQLIHRDVKPDNIFLAQDGTVKLGDFGLAKILREGASNVTVTGHVMGSPHFISPEQARGQRDIDFRADIYSLGCTLHSMMTGRTVFEGPDFVSIMYKHVNEVAQPLHTLLPNCPASVNHLLARMIAKDREQRPQSYSELVQQIVHARDDAALWEQSDERQRQRMSVAADERRGTTRWAYAVAVLAALAVAAALVYARRVEHTAMLATIITLADPSDRRDFIRSVESLPPLERIARVMTKMAEVNPGFSGNERFTVEADLITELSLSAVAVKNLWPLCALQHLRVLRCTGDAANKRRGDLTDLSPLAELPLEEVDCSWTNVEDLSPLTKLPLKTLRCANTRVQNLAPLQGLPLVELDITATAVSDLMPLKGMALVSMRCADTRVRDLSPLRGAPLKSVSLDPRLLRGEGETVKSWAQLETINGSPLRAVAGRLLPRAPK